MGPLIADFADINALAFFLEISQHRSKVIEFLLILLLFDQLYFEVFFVLFELLFDDSSISY